MAEEPDLVLTAGFSDAKLVAEANKVVELYRKKGNEAQKAFQDSQGKVTDTQAMRAHMKQLDTLSRAYDPVYRATKQYEKTVKDLDRALSVGAISQKQHTDQVVRAARQFNQASEETQASIMRTGGGLQNLGFQVGDFATQVGAGTSAAQALGQQLPQLLGGFGTLGALMGAGAAIAIPLGAALLKVAMDTETLDDKLKSLEKTTDAYLDAVDAASAPLDELRTKYGDLADEVARANEATVQLTAATARRDLLGSANRLGEAFGSVSPVERIFGQSDTEYDAVLRGQAERLAKALGGATAAQIDDVMMALRRLQTSNSLEAVAKDAENFRTILVSVAGSADEAARRFPEQLAAADTLVRAAVDQIGAASRRQREAQQELLDEYDNTTQQLKKLSTQRETAEKMLADAVEEGAQDRIDASRRVIEQIDLEISKTQQLARESDMAFQGMLRAYSEYADSRRAGNEWANSAAGFEAQYVAARAAGAGSQEEELVRAVTALSEQMGIAAKDLLAVMSFETGGRLRPDVMGPTTKNGQHFGLIQFGDKGAGPRYGVTPNSSITEQVVAAGRYLQDAGVKAGDSLANIYAAVLSGDARKINASDLASGGVVGNVSQATSGEQFAPHLARAEGLLAAYGSIAQQTKEDAQEAEKALKDQIRERERLAKQAKEYGDQLARNLLTDQETAKLNAQQAEQIAAIKAEQMGPEAESRAIAAVTAEVEKQRAILMLLADAKKRNVDLDAMLSDGSMTYRQAIEALGEAKRAEIIATNERAIAEGRVAEAQQLMADAQERTKQGLLDSIVAGQSFTEVLAGVAQMFAKVALEAALFNTGPWASGGQGGGILGGLFGGVFKFLGGGFASGGYTGSGGRYDPAGVVHKGEYVMSAPAVQRIGVPTLEAIHRGGTISGGSRSVALTIDLRGTTGDKALDDKIARAGQRILQQVPAVMDNVNKRQR